MHDMYIEIIINLNFLFPVKQTIKMSRSFRLVTADGTMKSYVIAELSPFFVG